MKENESGAFSAATIRKQVIAGMLLVYCGASHSAAPSYSHVELGRESGEINIEDGGRHHFKASDLAASWRVSDHLFLLAEVKNFERGNVPGHTPVSIGAGARWSVFKAGDFYTTVNYNLNADDSQQNEGFGFALGFRSKLADRVEIDVSAGILSTMHRTVGRIPALKFGGTVFLTDSLAVGVSHYNSIVSDDYSSATRVSIRYDFGRAH
jgi:hypothetical protein